MFIYHPSLKQFLYLWYLCLHKHMTKTICYRLCVCVCAASTATAAGPSPVMCGCHNVASHTWPKSSKWNNSKHKRGSILSIGLLLNAALNHKTATCMSTVWSNTTKLHHVITMIKVFMKSDLIMWSQSTDPWELVHSWTLTGLALHAYTACGAQWSSTPWRGPESVSTLCTCPVGAPMGPTPCWVAHKKLSMGPKRARLLWVHVAHNPYRAHVGFLWTRGPNWQRLCEPQVGKGVLPCPQLPTVGLHWHVCWGILGNTHMREASLFEVWMSASIVVCL